MDTRSSATTGGRPSGAAPAERAVGRVRTFWQRVTEGIQISELWAQFRAEARTSYGLYSRDVDWDEVRRGKRWKRPFRAAGALFWAMLMKLSPARRLLLLAAIAALLFFSFQVETQRGSVVFVSVGILSPGVLLLFLLLALELADRVTMKRDLEIAREIQRWLVPELPPQVPGYDIAFVTRPANTVAGDYYDTIPRAASRDPASKNGRLLLVVADVAGKSVPAAILMATFQASLRAVEATGSALGDLVQALNGYVCANSQSGLRFITAFFGELAPATGELSYTCAGHLPALVRRTSGAVDELSEGGLPLGIEEDEKFPSGQERLEPGEILLIYTDGVVEAVNAQGEEFGRARLLATLAPCDAANSAAEILRQITHVLDGFVGAASQHDDLTCMVVRRNRTS
ncbi:MAG TPA: PP2C family protein-serine/threonine phosphatase [Candidatus Acidoferrales bacterium]|nr:PP2C family protein-serine/threonine phosphatase [Candidatus Acidoferrales bacterium]